MYKQNNVSIIKDFFLIDIAKVFVANKDKIIR